jgi:hypothetical protein
MNSLQMKPEFNDLPGAPVSAGGGNSDHGAAGDAGAVLCNPMGSRRLRRSGRALRLAPPSDDGFHLFRVY